MDRRSRWDGKMDAMTRWNRHEVIGIGRITWTYQVGVNDLQITKGSGRICTSMDTSPPPTRTNAHHSRTRPRIDSNAGTERPPATPIGVGSEEDCEEI